MNSIITISRQYGSGGREIGEKLAKRLGVPFYDNELITRAAKESGFAEAAFENAEKKATNSLLYSIAMGMNAYGNQDIGFTHLSLDDQIYLAQSNVIRKVAMEGPCVIVGRCADYVLRDMDNVVNIFVWADLDYRRERAINHYHLQENKAEDSILKIDKRRANYYNYHASEKWGRAENYHLSIKSNYVGIDGAVQCIIHFLENGERR
ncbi:cytidylate kinase-like family protein [Mobilitalea sibirica]|uniref:Cytidylate kinase-like family protein n=1 Tax=Mobilitalea sibirica TaxID=1462919 RepID=A0A8J7H3S2_9FIRM|nr:cytidylate kinase-like family protein [Mobilitalea sibirica]MBH1941700.1 cytidylate kinase-like family protein [Mobilitalea sibirica]